MYADFVSEVDPQGGMMDRLLQEEVVSFEQKDKILAEKTRQERCRHLLDVLFASSNPRAFVVLRQSLDDEKKSWIVERIDSTDSTSSASAVDPVMGQSLKFETILQTALATYSDTNTMYSNLSISTMSSMSHSGPSRGGKGGEVFPGPATFGGPAVAQNTDKKLSYCWETVRRESMPRIAEMDAEMTT